MRMKSIIVLAVLSLTTHVACTPHHTWHTVSPETLDELAVDGDEPSSSPYVNPGVRVACRSVETSPAIDETRQSDACRATITSKDHIELYALGGDPVTLPAFSFVIDDGQLYEVQPDHLDPRNGLTRTRKIMSLDDVAAVRIRDVDPEPTLSSRQSYALGLMALPMFVSLLLAGAAS